MLTYCSLHYAGSHTARVAAQAKQCDQSVRQRPGMRKTSSACQLCGNNMHVQVSVLTCAMWPRCASCMTWQDAHLVQKLSLWRCRFPLVGPHSGWGDWHSWMMCWCAHMWHDLIWSCTSRLHSSHSCWCAHWLHDLSFLSKQAAAISHSCLPRPQRYLSGRSHVAAHTVGEVNNNRPALLCAFAPTSGIPMSRQSLLNFFRLSRLSPSRSIQ